MVRNFVHVSKRDFLLNISAYGEVDDNKPCIIFVHGFKGFKDWGFGPYIYKFFEENGFYVLAFNFSHNGVGNALTEFTELDKFAENTFSLEVEELSEIISFAKTQTKNSKIYLLGHSRGGAISLLTASKSNDVSAVVVWSSVATFDRYSGRQKEAWRKKGYFEVLNSRTKQIMRLNISLLNDLERNKNGSLNIQNAVSWLNKPLLIVHGNQDLAVPISEGQQLFEWSDKNNTEFVSIEGAGHTFNCQHPFVGSNEKFETILKTTYQFFNNINK